MFATKSSHVLIVWFLIVRGMDQYLHLSVVYVAIVLHSFGTTTIHICINFIVIGILMNLIDYVFMVNIDFKNTSTMMLAHCAGHCASCK